MDSTGLVNAIRNGGLAREQAMAEIYASCEQKFRKTIKRAWNDKRLDINELYHDAFIAFIVTIEKGNTNIQSVCDYINQTGINLLNKRAKEKKKEEKGKENLKLDHNDSKNPDTIIDYPLLKQEEEELLKALKEKIGNDCWKLIFFRKGLKYPLEEIVQLFDGKYSNTGSAKVAIYKCMQKAMKTVAKDPKLKESLKKIVIKWNRRN